MARVEAKSHSMPQNRNSLGMLNTPSLHRHSRCQLFYVIIYVPTGRPQRAFTQWLRVCVSICVCVCTYTHIYKISWDDGHRIRGASANMRGWTPGIRDKSGAGSREQELREEGSEPPWHDQAHQHQSHTPEQPWENRKPEL